MIRELIFLLCVYGLEAARILAVFPTPSFSHQIVFRPLTQELAKRGHEVVVITTDPAFPKGAPANLTEIDVHNVSYSIWRENILKSSFASGNQNELIDQMAVAFGILTEIFEEQMAIEDVKTAVYGKQKYDLLIIEGIARSALGLSHLYKVPVVQFSSLPPVYNSFQQLGAPTHRLMYPEFVRQKLVDLTLWDKVKELYTQFRFENIMDNEEIKQDASVKRIFGPDTPPLTELYNNVDLLFQICHSIWDANRPVPPSVVYLGGLHRSPPKDLPKDLQAYLDSSKNGVIYISYGTNVSPSALPADKIQMIVNVFSRLPYDVLWKWDKDVLPGQPKNVKISKWLPQSDLLRHPKLKVFVTQGGLQSTDEAIDAGVPLIGMPMLGDQWFNVENYVKHGIGLRLDMDTLTEEKFQNTLERVIKDPSFKRNIIKLRDLMNDQPSKPLDRAVWWVEHLLRHGGGRHLRSPAANMHWTQYYEIELISYLLAALLILLTLAATVIFYSVRFVGNMIRTSAKLKSN